MSVPLDDHPQHPPHHKARQAWMGLLARAEPTRLAMLWAGLARTPDHVVLRAPEIGTVMVRGRAGAVGAPFNLGEMSVTRCSVKLSACGTVGHAYVQGRDRDHARTAALLDALMQTDAAAGVRAGLLEPLQQAEAAWRQARAEKAAATRVEFLTLARGED